LDDTIINLGYLLSNVYFQNPYILLSATCPTFLHAQTCLPTGRKVGKKGHLRQIEDSTKSMLHPARLTPTSLAQEAYAPLQPPTIGVDFTLFVHAIQIIFTTVNEKR
jgi:hypothetical protein